jgi:hypothetical protein
VSVPAQLDELIKLRQTEYRAGDCSTTTKLVAAVTVMLAVAALQSHYILVGLLLDKLAYSALKHSSR